MVHAPLNDYYQELVQLRKNISYRRSKLSTIALSHVEPTPNPNAFKFHTDTQLAPQGESLSFQSADQAERFPFAKAIFDLGEVDAVLIAEDFVSVSGTRSADWKAIRELIEESVPKYDVESANKLAADLKEERAKADADAPKDEMSQKVEEIMDTFIRPALAGDGGGVELLSIEGKVITIRYQGACGSCPTSTASTLSAIENLLKEKVDPEVVLQPG